MSNANTPAFPLPLGNENIDPTVAGLTKREYFAAMAMQGMLALGPIQGQIDASVIGQCKHAVRVADALLVELEKESQK